MSRRTPLSLQSSSFEQSYRKRYSYRRSTFQIARSQSRCVARRSWNSRSVLNPDFSGCRQIKIFETHERHDRRKGKRLEWWMSMEESGKVSSKEKRRLATEWWKEEYCDELTKKKKKKDKKQSKGMSFDENESDWWPHNDELYAESKKRKKRRSKS